MITKLKPLKPFNGKEISRDYKIRELEEKVNEIIDFINKPVSTTNELPKIVFTKKEAVLIYDALDSTYYLNTPEMKSILRKVNMLK